MVKYALVTGASSGIGYSLAISLSKRGYTVFGGAPENEVELMEPLKSLGVIPFAIDIRSAELIKRAVELVRKTTNDDKLDLLYNNAGIAIGGPGFVFDDAEVQNFISINLTGHILVTKYFAPFVINARGIIVYTASIAAIVPLLWSSIYCATKAGIDAYARGIRAELLPFGVSVHSVITGGVNTQIGIKAHNVKPFVDPGFNIEGIKESLESATTMTADCTPPDVYAESVVKKITRGYSGFHLYEGYLARLLKFVAAWLPLSLQYYMLGRRFKQLRVFAEIRKRSAKPGAWSHLSKPRND